jgi:hypothetical protein
MYGSAVSKIWNTILVDTPFFVPWTGECVKYSTGQPMGAYSSWSTFTITHHVILHYIHDYLGLEERFYVILGDDIVISHDDVAREYLRIMKELGVGISLPKSHISQNMYEFAKRLFLEGQEITGIQVRGLYSNINKYHLIYQMVYVLVFERGYVPEKYTTIPHLIGLLYSQITKYAKHDINLEALVRMLHAFNRFIQFNDVEAVNDELKRRYPNSAFQSLTALEINNMIYLSADTAINRTTAKYIGYAERLMKSPVIAEQFAWGTASETDLWTSPLWYMTQMPVVQALANLTTSLNRARKLDSIKDLISTIALPSDDVFSESRRTALVGATAQLAKVTFATIDRYIIHEALAPMPNPNLTSTVLGLISSELRAFKVPKTVGLIPGMNELDKPKEEPKAPNPYGLGVAMW